jgi:hypothetical protein
MIYFWIKWREFFHLPQRSPHEMRGKEAGGGYFVGQGPKSVRKLKKETQKKAHSQA